MTERHLAKVKVVGSNPARDSNQRGAKMHALIGNDYSQKSCAVQSSANKNCHVDHGGCYHNRDGVNALG